MNTGGSNLSGISKIKRQTVVPFLFRLCQVGVDCSLLDLNEVFTLSEIEVGWEDALLAHSE